MRAEVRAFALCLAVPPAPLPAAPAKQRASRAARDAADPLLQCCRPGTPRIKGDTFVVDVIDFNDETWLDRAGNHHSDALHLVERYTPLDVDHLNYEVAVEPDFQILESECHAMQPTS